MSLSILLAALLEKVLFTRLATMELKRETMMPQQFSQSVDGCRFHLKVSDTMLTKRKFCEAVDQIRVTKPET